MFISDMIPKKWSRIKLSIALYNRLVIMCNNFRRGGKLWRLICGAGERAEGEASRPRRKLVGIIYPRGGNYEHSHRGGFGAVYGKRSPYLSCPSNQHPTRLPD